MPADRIASRTDLIERADRAIADALTTRTEVRAGLVAAGRRRPHRPWAGDAPPCGVPPLGPLLPDGFLEPWWSVARSLGAAGDVLRAADEELERRWRRCAPAIRTTSILSGE